MPRLPTIFRVHFSAMSLVHLASQQQIIYVLIHENACNLKQFSFIRFIIHINFPTNFRIIDDFCFWFI